MDDALLLSLAFEDNVTTSSGLEPRVTALEQQMRVVESSLATLSAHQDDLTVAVTGALEDLTVLEGRVDDTEDRLAATESFIEGFSGELVTSAYARALSAARGGLTFTKTVTPYCLSHDPEDPPTDVALGPLNGLEVAGFSFSFTSKEFPPPDITLTIKNACVIDDTNKLWMNSVSCDQFTGSTGEDFVKAYSRTGTSIDALSLTISIRNYAHKIDDTYYYSYYLLPSNTSPSSTREPVASSLYYEWYDGTSVRLVRSGVSYPGLLLVDGVSSVTTTSADEMMVLGYSFFPLVNFESLDSTILFDSIPDTDYPKLLPAEMSLNEIRSYGLGFLQAFERVRLSKELIDLASDDRYNALTSVAYQVTANTSSLSYLLRSSLQPVVLPSTKVVTVAKTYLSSKDCDIKVLFTADTFSKPFTTGSLSVQQRPVYVAIKNTGDDGYFTPSVPSYAVQEWITLDYGVSVGIGIGYVQRAPCVIQGTLKHKIPTRVFTDLIGGNLYQGWGCYKVENTGDRVLYSFSHNAVAFQPRVILEYFVPTFGGNSWREELGPLVARQDTGTAILMSLSSVERTDSHIIVRYMSDVIPDLETISIPQAARDDWWAPDSYTPKADWIRTDYLRSEGGGNGQLIDIYGVNTFRLIYKDGTPSGGQDGNPEFLATSANSAMSSFEVRSIELPIPEWSLSLDITHARMSFFLPYGDFIPAAVPEYVGELRNDTLLNSLAISALETRVDTLESQVATLVLMMSTTPFGGIAEGLGVFSMVAGPYALAFSLASASFATVDAVLRGQAASVGGSLAGLSGALGVSIWKTRRYQAQGKSQHDFAEAINPGVYNEQRFNNPDFIKKLEVFDARDTAGYQKLSSEVDFDRSFVATEGRPLNSSPKISTPFHNGVQKLLTSSNPLLRSMGSSLSSNTLIPTHQRVRTNYVSDDGKERIEIVSGVSEGLAHSKSNPAYVSGNLIPIGQNSDAGHVSSFAFFYTKGEDGQWIPVISADYEQVLRRHYGVGDDYSVNVLFMRAQAEFGRGTYDVERYSSFYAGPGEVTNLLETTVPNSRFSRNYNYRLLTDNCRGYANEIYNGISGSGTASNYSSLRPQYDWDRYYEYQGLDFYQDLWSRGFLTDTEARALTSLK